MAQTMARRPRIQFSGAMYHVMARGNRRSTIFHDDDDRRRFIDLLDLAAALYDLLVFAVCLMGNHYHLVLETPGCNLSDAMQFINGVFAQRSNRRHGQTGHVFEGRFRSLIIQRESYLMRAARYVVRNPVRASLVTDASAWPWSSYRATAGLEPVPRWLHVDWIKRAFQTGSIVEARQRYVEYVNAPAEPKPGLNLNALVLGTKQYRTCLMDDVRGGRIDREMPWIAKPVHRPSLAELFEGLEEAAEPRDQLIYRARADYGYRLSEIARVLGIDRSTASKAAKRWGQAVNRESM